MLDRLKIKISIGKLIELAYSKNEGLTKAILLGLDNFKVNIDERGNVRLSGNAGMMTFDGDPALRELGAKLKMASISFEQGAGDEVRYTAAYHFGGAGSISLSGAFDPFELIKACSGLLCNAARVINLDDRKRLQVIMGN